MNVGIVADRMNRKMTGVGNYVKNLLRELDRIKTNDNIYLLNYKDSKKYNHLKTKIINNPLKNITKSDYYLWHLYFLPHGLEKLDLELVHIPENASFSRRIRNMKKVITVYDLIAYLFPFQVDLLTAIRYKLLIPKVINNADKIITISENTKRDIIKNFGVAESKIKVIYLAAGESYKELSNKEFNFIFKKYQLPRSYLFYVGNISKHKNVDKIIEAFKKIKSKTNYKLVIAGKLSFGSKDIKKKIKDLDLQDDVIFTGYVPEEDLPALYNGASLFVYPSFYEGFGLPPLEAMQCGCPVITSNTSSLPEVVGNAGIMVDPNDVDELAKQMERVLTNRRLQQKMRKAGLKQAKKFSWEKCARETLKVYEEVLK